MGAEWTEQDIRALQAYWRHSSGLDLAKTLGGRHSTKAIQSMAWKLGLRKNAKVASAARQRWNTRRRDT